MSISEVILRAVTLPAAVCLSSVYIFVILDVQVNFSDGGVGRQAAEKAIRSDRDKVLQRSHAYPIISVLKIPKPKKEDKSFRAERKPPLLSSGQSFPLKCDLWASIRFELRSFNIREIYLPCFCGEER